ncbi:hypothetical protein PVAP13_1KG104639 [Panicum virgatum]|uniref:Secreted peptide n=1 Tax=Panicum virgatum TaxID=38727 RepID=A0A8T0XC61_PANVG|nr:hypothetical protein PVAP13_1KG104639 [Panicum virgatum]
MAIRSCAYILTVHVCLACSWEAHVVVRYYSQLRVKNLVNRMAFNSISITAIFFCLCSIGQVFHFWILQPHCCSFHLSVAVSRVWMWCVTSA